MKRILPSLSLIFLLFWAVLWAQTDTNSTAFQLSSLTRQEKFSKAAALISKWPDDSTRAGQWEEYSRLVIEHADSIFYGDSAPWRAFDIIDSALLELHRWGRADSPATAYIWTWKAYYYGESERFTDAIDAYNTSIRIHEANDMFLNNELAFCYNHVAQAYMRLGDNINAAKCFKASFENDTLHEYTLSNYAQYANNAYWQGNYELGLEYFEQGKKYVKTGNENALAGYRSTGAALLTKKGRFQEASVLFKQALAYYEKETPYKCLRTLSGLAEIAELTGKQAEAEQHYRRAERIGLAYYGDRDKSREMAKLYCEWGDFLLSHDQDAEALGCFQKALVQAFPTFNDLDLAANPKRAEAPTETWAMYASARKAAVLLRKPSVSTRILADSCFVIAFATAVRLRKTYDNDEAKLFFAKNNFNIQREAVSNLWALFQETRDAAYLNRLFSLLETNRANALREALQEKKALALTGVSDSLLGIESLLRHQIAVSQGKLAMADSTEIEHSQSEINRIERRYNELLTFLNKTYPRFREYSQAGQTAKLETIQKTLPSKAVLLSFFDAGDRYLCLALRQKNGLVGYEILRDSALDQTLSRFQTLLADKTGQETDPSAFFADAWFLKQRLLPDSILGGVENLVIVPDGRLAYLPFEVLLTAPHAGVYGTAPYLLRKHAVQYVWSAALLTENNAGQLPEKFVLHVAPFAGGARSGLAPLPNSLSEIPDDAAADLLSGEQARADTFLRRSAGYDILHLSTHAHAGQKEQPGIEFSDRTVALPELYAQRLNASLVALSACETSAGEFAEGEGVMSLARAFAYAGARSLVAGYWSVNDRSTANLFAAFYRHLKSGMTKSEALRQAKLDMLNAPGADARKMPYHWAAFTLSGADGPVALAGHRWDWWQWMLLVIAGAGLASVVRQVIRKKPVV